MSTVDARSADEWRAWLEENCRTENEVWLRIYHKNSSTASVQYNEAVEQALCFGWIDSLSRKDRPDSRLQRFSPRKPRSNWSASNRERVARLIELGLMTEAGQAAPTPISAWNAKRRQPRGASQATPLCVTSGFALS